MNYVYDKGNLYWCVSPLLSKAQTEEEVLSILQAYYLSHTSEFACGIKDLEKAVRRMRPILWGDCIKIGSDFYINSLFKYIERNFQKFNVT